MRVRRFREPDLSAILAVQAQCTQAAQWRPSDYLQTAGSAGGLMLVTETEPTTNAAPVLVGFGAFQQLLDEAELRNIAVRPTHRCRGVGRSLLTEAIHLLREAGIGRLFLEVRPSNAPARALYASMGFQVVGMRPAYYADPPEDALIMALEISPARADL